MAKEVCVISNDEDAERHFMAASPEPPKDWKIELHRAGVRIPSSPGVVIASELERFGLRPGTADRALAAEALECIGDGAVWIICVTPGPVSEELREFCASREIRLLAFGRHDFADQVRRALTSVVSGCRW